MVNSFKILLIAVIFLVVGCRNYHYEKLIVKQAVGNDTVIIKETRGEALSGGTLIFKKTKDSVHKIYMTNYFYNEALILGLNAKKDSLWIKFTAKEGGLIPNDTVMIWRADTLSVPWNTYIESVRLNR